MADDEETDLQQQQLFGRDTAVEAGIIAGAAAAGRAAVAAAVRAGTFIRAEVIERIADATGLIDIPVTSSCIASLSYKLGSGMMQVTFMDGSVYDVPDVSVSDFVSFLNARSKGSHWNRHFRGQSATQFAGSKKQRIKLGRR
jgi:hypothetical protein